MLTASGGPFRGRSRDELAEVTPEEALAHPTWDMGPVVTINSATLVNKGLEVIEAHLLFGIPMDDIEVVVHPTSVVHSMVEFNDGSTLAQASPADDADPDRARPGLARPGARHGAGGRLVERADLGVLPARRRGVPRRTPGPRGGSAGRHRAGGLQRRQRGVRARRSATGGSPFVDIVDTVATVLDRSPRRTLGAEISPSTTCWRPMPGPATQTAHRLKDPIALR